MNVANWTSRIVANAVVGLTKSDPSWPSVLRDAEFHVSIVEPEWYVDDPPSRRPAMIAPDVVLASNDGHLLVLSECKVGTVQADQLRRYGLATLDRLRTQSRERPVSSFEIVYWGTEPHRSSCETSLQGTKVSLACFSDTDLRLVRGTPDERFREALKEGVSLRGRRPPTRYLPLDTTSTLDEVIQEVLPVLVQLAIRGAGSFEPRDIVENIFSETYGDLHRAFRTGMQTSVQKALNELAKPRVLGDILSQQRGMWSLRADFGKPGGPQFPTAARRVLDHMANVRDMLALDI